MPKAGVAWYGRDARSHGAAAEARIGFVEVKAPSAKPRPLQERRHEQLRELGFQVSVLDAPEQIPGIIEEILNV